PDELYGEMLRLVAERDAPAVFALVDRLAEAGAGLGEFVSGAGETLRAVLVVGMGGEPEGLTEGLQGLVRRYAPALPPPDVVRMLTVLSETEVPLRASGNMRLAVEVLLLRWAMMSRTVELEEVIRALGGGTGEGGRGTSGAGRTAAAPVQVRGAARGSGHLRPGRRSVAAPLGDDESHGRGGRGHKSMGRWEGGGGTGDEWCWSHRGCPRPVARCGAQSGDPTRPPSPVPRPRKRFVDARSPPRRAASRRGRPPR